MVKSRPDFAFDVGMDGPWPSWQSGSMLIHMMCILCTSKNLENFILFFCTFEVPCPHQVVHIPRRCSQWVLETVAAAEVVPEERAAEDIVPAAPPTPPAVPTPPPVPWPTILCRGRPINHVAYIPHCTMPFLPNAKYGQNFKIRMGRLYIFHVHIFLNFLFCQKIHRPKGHHFPLPERFSAFSSFSSLTILKHISNFWSTLLRRLLLFETCVCCPRNGRALHFVIKPRAPLGAIHLCTCMGFLSTIFWLCRCGPRGKACVCFGYPPQLLLYLPSNTESSSGRPAPAACFYFAMKCSA